MAGESVEIINVVSVRKYTDKKTNTEKENFEQVGRVVLYKDPKGKSVGVLELFMYPDNTFPLFRPKKENEAPKGTEAA